MTEKILTIIIPTYNVEDYICTCIDSVLNQSFKNLYIYIIDDCSQDATYSILKSYEEKHSNILLFRNEKNKGASFCRNYCLTKVKTKYVAFLDGDDWVDSNCYKKAISKLEKNPNIDIALWNINTVYNRSTAIKRYYYEEENIITNQYALSLYTRSHISNIYISPLLGNKVIRLSLISQNNLLFKGFYYEDDIFIYYAFLYARKIQIITNANLYYLQRDDSLMHSFSKQNITELYSTFVDLKNDLIIKHLWDLQKNSYYSFFEKCLKNILVLLHNTANSESEERDFLSKILEGFYTNISVGEYTQFCDLSLFTP